MTSVNPPPPEGRVTTEVRGNLLLIGVDRPHKRNAFGPEMLQGLSDAYGRLDTDDDLRCGVLFAEGPHFTAGLDLMAVAPMMIEGKNIVSGDAQDPWGLYGRVRRKPVVMAVQGMCLTLGIELALNSDVVIATSDTKFAQIEVKRGIFPFGGATLRMPKVAGWGNAMRYLLTGDEFDAQEAHRLGIVQEVVEPGRQLGRAIELAERIARQAPLAVQATLANARLAVEVGFEAASKELIPTLQRLMKTEDVQEGLASFVERREAAFKGR